MINVYQHQTKRLSKAHTIVTDYNSNISVLYLYRKALRGMTYEDHARWTYSLLHFLKGLNQHNLWIWIPKNSVRVSKNVMFALRDYSDKRLPVFLQVKMLVNGKKTLWKYFFRLSVIFRNVICLSNILYFVNIKYDYYKSRCPIMWGYWRSND